MIFLTNTQNHPMLSEMVQRAARRTNLDVIFVDRPATIHEIIESGGETEDMPFYHPDPRHASLFAADPAADLRPFWNELERLRVEYGIKKSIP